MLELKTVEPLHHCKNVENCGKCIYAYFRLNVTFHCLTLTNTIKCVNNIYIYIYMCVCVCVYACIWYPITTKWLSRSIGSLIISGECLWNRYMASIPVAKSDGRFFSDKKMNMMPSSNLYDFWWVHKMHASVHFLCKIYWLFALTRFAPGF